MPAAVNAPTGLTLMLWNSNGAIPKLLISTLLDGLAGRSVNKGVYSLSWSTHPAVFPMKLLSDCVTGQLAASAEVLKTKEPATRTLAAVASLSIVFMWLFLRECVSNLPKNYATIWMWLPPTDCSTAPSGKHKATIMPEKIYQLKQFIITNCDLLCAINVKNFDSRKSEKSNSLLRESHVQMNFLYL